MAKRTARQIIQEEFRRSKYENVTELKRAFPANPCSVEVMSAVINRDREPRIDTTLFMLTALGASNNLLREAFEVEGLGFIGKRFEPWDFSAEELAIVEDVRSLPKEKRKLVLDMIRTLKG